MTLLRTLLSVLLLAALLAPSAARAGEQEDQAELFLRVFSTMCPSMMTEQLGKNPTFMGDGGTLVANLANDVCGCFDTELSAMPMDKMLAMFNEGSASKALEATAATCTARAFKPRFGELCRLAAKNEGRDRDDAEVVAACGCAQERADGMSDEALGALIESNDKAATDAVFGACEPDA